MSKINSSRPGCKDVFKAFLVKNASYDSIYEIPSIRAVNEIPTALIPFSKSITAAGGDSWVHFYEDDYLFERIWRYPRRYLQILRKFKGVITPDFSLFRDMPFGMQVWNTYRSHALGHWFQENGLSVIANVRFSDQRSYELSCAGVPKHGIISIGSYGCLKCSTERRLFVDGLDFIVNRLLPKTIIVYGSAPDDIFLKLNKLHISIINFESDLHKFHKSQKGG